MAGKLEDLKGQLQITEALNKALEHQLGLQKQIAAGMSRQAQFAKDMAGAAKKGSGLKNQITEQRSLTKELENTKQKSKDLTNELQQGMKNASGSVGGFKDMLGGLGKFMTSWTGMTLGIFGGLIGGITKIFSGLLSAIKGIFSLITNTIKVSMGVIKSLIAAPFKMMDTFTRLAQEMHSINVVINGARQAVNGMIGDHKTLGDVTSQAYKVAKKAVNTLPGGVFGPHEQGAAQRIKLAGELVAAFGPYQKQLSTLSKTGAKFAIQMKKNLGFTGENFQKVAAVSKAYGKDLGEEFKTISLGIVATAKAGGLNVKTLGKEFSTFYAKLGPATGMATHKIVAMAASFNKMGISADTAMGMFTKFDTLEGGAEVVSKMSRSLGIHVSQTQMIMAREKGPLEQLRIVQESMRSAGKSFEDLSYDGKKMIAEMFGGDQAAAMKAFGRAGMESSDSIEKAAKAAKNAKDARDMPKLMQKLNKSIEKIADSFGKIMAPFEAFTHGLTRGGKDNKFVKNMMDISRAFGKIGREVGKLLQESGFLEKMTTSLGDFAKNIQKMMPLVRELVESLFSDQPASKRSPYEIIKEIGSKLLGSYGEFYSNMSKFMLQAVAKLAPTLIKMLAWLGKSINGMLTSIMDGTFGQNTGKMFDNLEASISFDNKGVQKEAKTAIAAVKKSWNKEMGPKQRSFFEKDAMGNMKKVTKKAGVGEALASTLMVALQKSATKLGKIFGDILGTAFGALWDKYGTTIAVGAAIYMFGPALLKAFMSTAVLGAIKAAVVGAAGALSAGAVAAGATVGAAVLVAGAGGYYLGKAIGGDRIGAALADSVFAAINPAEKRMRASAKENAKYWNDRAARNKAKRDRDLVDKLYEGVNDEIKTGNRQTLDLLAMKIKADTHKTSNEKKQLLDNIKKRKKDFDEADAAAAATAKMRKDVGGQAGLNALESLGITKVEQVSTFNAKGKEKISTKGGINNLFLRDIVEETTMLNAAKARGDTKEASKVEAKILKMMGGNKQAFDSMMALQSRASKFMESEGYDMDKTNIRIAGKRQRERDGYKNAFGGYNPLRRGSLLGKDAGNERRMGFLIQQFLMKAQNSPEKIAQQKNDIKQVDMALAILKTQGKNQTLIKDVAALKLTDARLKELKLEAYIPQIQKASMAAQTAAAKAQKAQKPAAGGSVASGIDPGKPDTKKLMRKVSQAGSKVKGVKVKHSKKVKALGRLPVRVLNLLASKKASKRMFGAGLEMTQIMDKLGPAAKTVSEALNSAAIPALQGTATASQQAVSSLATTVVMLSYVRDKLAEVQTAYSGILKTVIEVRKEADKLKGKHSAKITTETGKLEVNIHVNVDSKQISQALEKTPVVTWSGDMGSQS
jgi:hypothetical protein